MRPGEGESSRLVFWRASRRDRFDGTWRTRGELSAQRINFMPRFFVPRKMR